MESKGKILELVVGLSGGGNFTNPEPPEGTVYTGLRFMGGNNRSPGAERCRGFFPYHILHLTTDRRNGHGIHGPPHLP